MKVEAGASVDSLPSILFSSEQEGGNGSSNGADSGGILAQSWDTIRSTVRSVGSIRSSQATKAVCSICLDPYEPGETVCWSLAEECNHIFHEDCIVEWLIKHDNCPMCRSNMLESLHDVEEGGEMDLPQDASGMDMVVSQDDPIISYEMPLSQL
eukprot:CAMPEP_0183329084 /NCGR_PEP_ID=MMETSP0160_2-20130417/84612_1 /TAXON_ID=2839 ORGANISM="Odontella Sinensis, Strain Grunow 1884" /NCGR_SAMPLE_ID=MMETSP0160_2 /ASSEMBLY_ACC=CAM_ASM_000250 /LENGTH=153 /DNA_ID=CAMNT_0025497263 /DNA_START=160 /DNA_END=621 /DNA_ORIENTATION=-